MTSADGRWTITFNGAIYNHRELRSQLQILGHDFQSQGDTEVLLKAFIQWGSGVLARLVGMFAFVIHDRHTGCVTLARDPFGIKPLYIARSKKTLVFASEIGALLEFPGISRAVDPSRYLEFLVSGRTDHGSGTLFADVRQLPAAHYLQVQVAAPEAGEPVRYWNPELNTEFKGTFRDAAERVRETFLDSMRLHLRADVPIGFSLSGGNDSSAIVMAARTLLGSEAELHTFSFVPSEPQINEEIFISIANGASRATPHFLRLSPDELLNGIDRLAFVQGEPFPNPVIFAQYRIFELAKAHGMKIMLGGEGADEVLAGYDRHLVARLASCIRQYRFAEFGRALPSYAASLGASRSATVRRAVRLALPPGLGRLARAARDVVRNDTDWLDKTWFEERDASTPEYWITGSKAVLRSMLDYDLRHSQELVKLRCEDRNAMAFSIENRVPFLTTKLVELLFSLPEEYLIAPDGTRKAVFREAMRGIVPDQILDRRQKIGFSIPTVFWFGALRPWIAGRLAHVASLGGVNKGALERRWKALESGWHTADPILMWRCVSASVWAEQYGVTFN